jgi:general secretion pathway protein E
LSAVKEKIREQAFLSELSVLPESEVDRLELLWKRESSSLSFPEFIVGMGAASEADVFAAVARDFELRLIRSENYAKVDGLAGKVSVNFLKSHRSVPCGIAGDSLLVAVSDPGNKFVSKSISLACGRPVELVVGLPSEIESAIEELFGDGRSQIARIADVSKGVQQTHDAVEAEKLKDMASEAPVVKLVNVFFNKAQIMNASDIHLEPFEDELKLRFRVDGVLVEVEAPPRSMAAAVLSRLKLMAGLNIAEHRLPQDGRIRLQQNGKEFDVRVSTVPTVHGESIVMRLLDRSDINLSLEALGFDVESASLLRAALQQPHGMILVCGPTGSGKTTTLYAALQLLNSPTRKIITIEDPVEYQLSGVNQIQVQPSIGLSFSSALRAIVRQDPDAIMVGELRDLETASICVQSALTGHLVLSTVHTNDAAGAITRLLDMGVEGYLLPSTLNLIVAQRLVRKLCEHCKHPEALVRRHARYVDSFEQFDLTKATTFVQRGCEKCNQTGYRGRIAIAELLSVDETIRNLISQEASADLIKLAAQKNGMRSLSTDGVAKVLSGCTTLDEVFRVTRDSK